MTYNIISTGSTGNAVLLDGRILIDIGVSWKKLRPYADKIRVVLLTHIHGDHFNPATVRMLRREHPAVRWGCCEWMVKPLTEAGADSRMIDVLRPDCQSYRYDFENPFLVLSVHALSIPHDVQNCGYEIGFGFIRGNGFMQERVFYVTDCATLDGISAEDYDLYFVEANHGEEEIQERIKRKLDAGEYAYEARAKRNHLSQEQALDWLSKNMWPKSKYVLLHQHQDRWRDSNAGAEGTADGSDT